MSNLYDLAQHPYGGDLKAFVANVARAGAYR